VPTGRRPRARARPEPGRSPINAIGFIKGGNIEGDDHAAADALERAWKLAPHDTDVLSLLGSFLAVLGRTDEAVARYAEAAKLDPRSVLVPAAMRQFRQPTPLRRG